MKTRDFSAGVLEAKIKTGLRRDDPIDSIRLSNNAEHVSQNPSRASLLGGKNKTFSLWNIAYENLKGWAHEAVLLAE